MQKAVPRQRFWYWGIVGLLLTVGVGAITNSKSVPVAIRFDEAAAAHNRGEDVEPSVEELAEEFHQFREEVAQLAPAEQQEVWQSLQQNSTSLLEQTLYTFFALPAEKREPLLDRVIDRIETRHRKWRELHRLHGESENWPIQPVSMAEGFSESLAGLSLEERLAVRRDSWPDTTEQALAMRQEFSNLVNQKRQVLGLHSYMRRPR